ncbi:MAG: polyphosphate kinase 1, partial [Lutibacter sp.]|nr:polyphosphate kinase 1 [Lutibacter sp.]
MKKNLIPSEISWLSFNQCLLEEASDMNNQLYERIKFLAIHSSNLDEFFRVKINRLSIDKSSDKKGLLSAILKEVNYQQEG